MGNLYGKAVALAVPVFLFPIALELIVNRKRRIRCYLADSINRLSCGIVSTVVRGRRMWCTARAKSPT